jgi:hypothetical protein
MTASEQLSIWAADPKHDLLVGITYDEKPYVVERIKARDALVGLDRWKAEINVARVAELNGVTCIIVEGRVPDRPQAAFRVVLSAAEPFI